MTTLTMPPLAPGLQLVDPQTGTLTKVGLFALLSLQNRTGGTLGINVTTVNQQVTDNTSAITSLNDLSTMLADPVDVVDVPPVLLLDTPDTVPDLGEPALLALALGDME